MDITIYAPDRHLVYDADTPERKGIGGGVTARIRLAAALAARGHRVAMVCNCPEEREIGGVRYVPLDRCTGIDTEVLVVQSSGGALDVRPVLELAVRAHVQVGWCQGFAPVQGMDEASPDGIVLCSDFLRSWVRDEWRIDRRRLWVFHNGVEGGIGHRRPWNRRRERKRLLYTSHPDKGLDAALGVLGELRASDASWQLHVFGGAALWGQDARDPLDQPGVIDHGLVGQRALRSALPSCGFSLHLQDFEEPFGISMAQAMAAGCVAVASPVGAFPEVIDHGRNAFLVGGAHHDRRTVERAADLVQAVAADPSWWASVSRQAEVSALAWTDLAAAWERWLRWLLDGRPADGPGPSAGTCPECGGRTGFLGDGYHCTGCGRYGRTAPSL